MRYFIGIETAVRRTMAASNKFMDEHPEYEQVLQQFQMTEVSWFQYHVFCAFGIKLGAK